MTEDLKTQLVFAEVCDKEMSSGVIMIETYPEDEDEDAHQVFLEFHDAIALRDWLNMLFPHAVSGGGEVSSRDQPLGFGKHEGKTWRDIPDEYLEWLQTKRSLTAGIIRNRHALCAQMELECRRDQRNEWIRPNAQSRGE